MSKILPANSFNKTPLLVGLPPSISSAIQSFILNLSSKLSYCVREEHFSRTSRAPNQWEPLAFFVFFFLTILLCWTKVIQSLAFATHKNSRGIHFFRFLVSGLWIVLFLFKLTVGQCFYFIVQAEIQWSNSSRPRVSYM